MSVSEGGKRGVGRDTETAKSDAGREKGQEPAAGYGSVQELNLYGLPFFLCTTGK